MDKPNRSEILKSQGWAEHIDGMLHPPDSTRDVQNYHLIQTLINYACPGDVVDDVVVLVKKLVEIHQAAGGDWDSWFENRSGDWYDEVEEFLNKGKNE